MAANKAKNAKKYRQAKTAAKAAAKEAFPGKKQASKRDPKLKISAEDRMVAKEVSDQAKADLGKDYRLSKSEYNAQQKAAREKFRSEMREEFGEYGGKKATPAEAEVAKKETKPSVKKKAVKKAAPKKAAVKPAKTMGEVSKAVTDSTKSTPKLSKSAANKAAWAKMTPEQRKNWNANKPGAKPVTPSTSKSIIPAEDSMLRKSVGVPADKWSKMTQAEKQSAVKKSIKPKLSEPEVKQKVQKAMDDVEDSINRAKRPTLADLEKNEAKGLEEAKARVAAKNKALANSAKGKTQTPQAEKAKAAAKPEGKPTVRKVAAKPKKFALTRTLGKLAGKAFVVGNIGSEVGSVVKGSTEKDWRYIQKLENQLAAAKGQKPRYKNIGSNKNPIQAMTADASHMANLLSGGLVGQTRRDRMDQLNRAIAKASKTPAASKPSAGKTSHVATSQGGKKYLSPSHMSSSKKNVNISGGATTKYTVKKGDTLSGIAKNAGLTLAEVRSINPELMKNPKYKKGSMIWSGTKVNIKKK